LMMNSGHSQGSGSLHVRLLRHQGMGQRRVLGQHEE
jgi:hypothetical protein